MNKILIVHYSMDIGGAESSLLGLLQSLDYEKYQVDLLLLWPKGELLKFIPEEVQILTTPKEYLHLVLPIKEIVKKGNFPMIGARLMGKVVAKRYKSITYVTKQYCHKFALPLLPKVSGRYDLAISFIDPHYIVANKVEAKVKMAWMHTDFSRMDINIKKDKKMWALFDYIVQVSDACKKAFDEVHPGLKEKSIVIENILSKDFLYAQAEIMDVKREMPDDGVVKLLSIGRYSYPKNFDNLPYICRNIIDLGVNVKWYIIGYGSEEMEGEIKKNIKNTKMEGNVILLGKKENPYPYLAACDLYIQPSRYEGKCVAVREAQIFHKPVIITNYKTSPSQLTDGYDGVIVPMDNEGCAAGIAAVIQNKEVQQRLTENTKKNDYTNAGEMEKLYRLMERENVDNQYHCTSI